MDKDRLLKQLTVLEKASLVAGSNFMYTKEIERLNVRSLRMADGPHGLRKQIGTHDNGVSVSEPSTAFPTAVATGSSWNTDLLEEMGRAIGEECVHYGVNVLLGPGVNIKRNPLCGRNFEYFSEDPFLTGEMAKAQINGVQSLGVGVSVKHFALNNSENYRFMGNSIVDERAMREIYLKAFEKIVKESEPLSLMCAYNQINGVYCSQNPWLLDSLLRKEWGYKGMVMTDWGATHDRVEGLKAGLDLEMPGDTEICKKWIVEGISSGILEEETLNLAVKNLLNAVEKVGDLPKKQADFEKNHRLSCEIAEDSAVLLKNDGALPLNGEKLLVVGELFEKMRYQGSGSSMINPTFLVSPKNAFDERKVNYVYRKGYKENQTDVDLKLIDDALNAIDDCEKILVFAGLTDWVESEGSDRESLKLPKNQLALIEKLCETNKKVVVVLFGGSVMELPFADKVSALLNMFLPGQNGGNATANLLFGKKSPSGKLSETWIKEYADVPFGEEFGKGVNEVYKESVFVGYRYYASAKKEVRYPFGFGLSYTDFEYSDMTLEKDDDGEFSVSCVITNVGDFDGAEVVQLYVKPPKTQVFKAEKELKGFTKVYLKKGESKVVSIGLKKDDLRFYDVADGRWVLEKGSYELQICSDVLTEKLTCKLELDGERAENPYDPEVSRVYESLCLWEVNDWIFERMSKRKIPSPLPKKPVSLDSRFTDLKYSFMGKILFNAVLSVATKQNKRAEKLPEGRERDNLKKGALFLKRILESGSPISMSMSAGKTFPYNFAQGFVYLANGKFFKGIKSFCSKIRIKELSKTKEEK